TPTNQPSDTATPTFTPTNTPTDAPANTFTSTSTSTYTPTNTPTSTATPTSTSTFTATSTSTPCSVTYVSDDFSRTVSSGWGSAYTLSGGTVANFNVNGTTGTIAIDVLGERQARLGSVSQQDLTAQVRAATDKLAAGGNQKPSIVLRRVDGNNFYRFEMGFTA